MIKRTRRQKEKTREEKREEILTGWKPKTELGKKVLAGKIKNIDEILDKGIKIKEPEISDFLIVNLRTELVEIGGRSGKGGGIQRTPIRITTKMHKSGRRYTTTAFVIVGNEDGVIGFGKAKGEEGRLAIEKATRKAKTNLIKIRRGCGSWECGCGKNHSIPFKVEGKSGSTRIILMPAPKGVGLVANEESKKLFALAGIKDIWTKTYGETGTRFNLIKASFYALRNLHKYRGV